MCNHQQRFGLDVQFSALVHNFNILFPRAFVPCWMFNEFPAFANTRTLYATFMLLNCGSINNREIFYCDIGNGFSKIESFPSKNWLLFAIADHDQLGSLYSLAEKCLDRGVLYICGAGEACSEIDDAFDSVMVDRKLASLNRDLTQHDFHDSPMTTWHHDFDEGFWFSITTAYHEEELIDKVVVANLTAKNYELRIKELVEKIQAGWLPPD